MDTHVNKKQSSFHDVFNLSGNIVLKLIAIVCDEYYSVWQLPSRIYGGKLTDLTWL